MVKQVRSERRSYVRAKRVMSIQFRIVKSRRRKIYSDWYISTTKDMSIGGLAFYTDQDLRVNDVLEIKVSMSGILDIFKGFAKVLRVERKRTAAHYLVAIKIIKKAGRARSAKSYRPRRRIKVVSRKRV